MVRLFLAGIFVLSLSFRAEGQQGTAFERAEARLATRANDAFERGRERLARSIITRALRREATPEAIKAAETLMARFPNAADADLVLASLDDATQPHDAATARAIARAHFVRGELDEAHALLARRAQPQDPQALALLRELAAARVERGELALAQGVLELARRVMPQDRVLIFELASLHVARGSPDRAMALLQARLQFQVHDDDARRRLALVFHAVGRTDDAITELLRLGTAQDICSASRVALESGDAARAQALARRALGETNEPAVEAAAQRALGFALARAGSRQDAIRALRRALSLEPSVAAQSALDELDPASAETNDS